MCETNYQVVRAKRLASAWQLKMLRLGNNLKKGSFSRELERSKIRKPPKVKVLIQHIKKL